MRLLILSDVHANIQALQAIAKKETWDEAYCCGDLIDYGPFPAEVIRWMQNHHVHSVKGNHDRHVLLLNEKACCEAACAGVYKWAHWNYQCLSNEALTWLDHLPDTLLFESDGILYQMQHQYDAAYGTIESETQFQAFWKGSDKIGKKKRLLFGHSHRRCVHMLNDEWMWLNPGSVSYRRPDDPDKRSHYMMIDDGEIRFGAVSYDRSPLLSASYERLDAGNMLITELQDAFFFFGSAPTTRSLLPQK